MGQESEMDASQGAGESFAALSQKALGGDMESAKRLLAKPVDLKLWLDSMAQRRENEGALPTSEPSKFLPSYTERTKDSEDFLSRGLPQSPEALVEQYEKIEAGGAGDFKADVQGIERAILQGAATALREMLARSPMALWAMDFSLAQYEDENVLAFAAKYAPAGDDLEIIHALLEHGARLPDRRLNLVTSSSMANVEGIWAKNQAQVADALQAAGYEFNMADGLALLGLAMFEREQGGKVPGVAQQKIGWLDEIGRRAKIDWSAPMSAKEWQPHLDALKPWDQAIRANGGLADVFAQHARDEGPIGLGAWVGLASAPLREVSSWAELGPWLCDHGLAIEASNAARDSGATVTFERLAPWREQEELAALVGIGFQRRETTQQRL